MSLIRLERENEDAALVFRLQHVIAGAIRYVRPKYAHIVKIDNWFGARWRCFAGSRNGKDLHPKDPLAVPPFAPKRVVSEMSYRRSGDHLRRVGSRRLHGKPIPPSSVVLLEEKMHSGIYIWYSGNTAAQDRGSLMVYEVEKGGSQRTWYVEFRRRAGTWTISATVGISAPEVHELETAYANRLAPLLRHANDERRDADRALWERALDAAFSSDVARAMVLIDKYRSRKPDDIGIRLLHARNLGQRRAFAEAEQELRAAERVASRLRRRDIWLAEWADFCKARGDEGGSEAAYRELAASNPDKGPYWTLLGASLARQGKLEEAEAMHRHATQLPGDPDEAYLNLGYVLRATGRFEEAADAFESALQLCPDYPEASTALADVRAAIDMRDRDL